MSYQASRRLTFVYLVLLQKVSSVQARHASSKPETIIGIDLGTTL
jgi:hypothetical protein